MLPSNIKHVPYKWMSYLENKPNHHTQTQVFLRFSRYSLVI